MTRRKTGKPKAATSARRAGASTSKKALEGETPTISTIDIAAYPHILSLILDYSTSSTLVTLLRCSQFTFGAAAARLYRVLCVTPGQIESLIQLGYQTSNRGSSSTGPGRSFSVYMRAALDNVRTLHLMEYDPTGLLPSIPRGCMGNVETIVLHMSDDWHPYAIELQRLFTTLHPTKLYIRMSTLYLNPDRQHMEYPVLSKIPSSVTHIALLFPLACHSLAAPSVRIKPLRQADSPDGPSGPDVSVVLLPWAVEDARSDDADEMARRWSSTTSNLAHYTHFCPVSLVGAEYTGVLENQKRLVLSGQVEEEVTARYLSFRTFADWFDQLEPGTVFNIPEGATHWYRDVALRQGEHIRLQLKYQAEVEQHHAAVAVLEERRDSILAAGDVSVERRDALRQILASFGTLKDAATQRYHNTLRLEQELTAISDRLDRGYPGAT